MAHLTRTNSVCADPKSVLLQLVLNNEFLKIEHLISHNPGLLSEIYDHPFYKPILYLACKDRADSVTANTINCLVNKGADLQFIDTRFEGKEALHFATLGHNPLILKCIIEHYQNKGLDINVTTSNGNSALQLLIKEGNHDHEGFEDCARVLIESGIDINKTDERNAPPVYWAAKKSYINIIKLLLSCKNIDLDSYVSRNKTPRDLINDLNINVDEISTNINRENNNNNDILLDYIKQNNQEKFIELASQLDRIEDEESAKSFLQYACERHLLDVVKFLISAGVDKNRVSKKNPESPIEIAANKGYHLILKELLRESNTFISNNVLSNILPKLDFEIDEKTDYLKCFDILMSSNSKGINVNHKDKNGNYSLHYAARYGGPDVVLQLLKQKASLANRNKFDYLNIHEIDYNTLKQHFDTCIEAEPENKLDKESMTITFDYETLLPTKVERPTMIHDEEKKLCTYQITPETDAVLFMSKSSELKTLLKHPLITSFLYMKWYRIRWIFYTNLLFYVTFLLSLLLYIFAYYKEPKDKRNAFCYIFLFLTTCILLLREIFQIIVTPKKYFSNFENFIEISLIIFVSFMLFSNSDSPETKTQAAAFAILFAAFELLFLLGNYPGLTTNIVMLRTVSLNFFKFLLFYSILIVAFAFCFHTLFNEHSHTNQITNNTTDVLEEEDDKFFVNPIISMFKTIIMLTGEFEAGDLKFENYPVTSHLIFLAFVMTIAIILLNLLNGLAVSDTQEIKNEAELVGHIARAEYVAYAESMLFSSIIPTKLSNCYHRILPCSNRNRFKKLVSKPMAEKICLYPQYLKGYKLVVYPNQKGKVHFEDEQSKTCKCRNVCLDNTTIRRVRCLLQEKKEREKEEQEKQRLIDRQTEILDKINDLVKLMHR